MVILSDILPTGFECGVLNGKVAPGATVAIVGSGPIGLTALSAKYGMRSAYAGSDQLTRNAVRNHISEALTMAPKMHAAVVRQCGKPLVLEEWDIPTVGPGQILVKIEACGVCHTDLHAAKGDGH